MDINNFNTEEYLPLIKSIVKKYSGMGVPDEDLTQEGYIGLIEAVGKFKEDKDTKFSTYATYWIKKRILAALDKENINTKNMVSLPESSDQNIEDKRASIEIQSETINIPKNFPELEEKTLRLLYEKEFTLKEIAEELGISRERVRQLKEKGLRRLRSRL